VWDGCIAYDLGMTPATPNLRETYSIMNSTTVCQTWGDSLPVPSNKMKEIENRVHWC
jgi:hypothetical protein